MQKLRLTVRLSLEDIRTIDMFLRGGEFTTRSEFIRRAVREYSQKHMEEIIKKAEAMKKLQDLVNSYEVNEEYYKK